MYNVAGIRVTYYADHCGHQQDVAHQQLTRDQRAEIAGMLSMGIPFDDVLAKVQLSGDNAAVSRLHLTSKQDLKNITRDFHLATSVMRCANDADSVAAWVQQDQLNGQHSLVRYAKFQGAQDNVTGLADDDFMLVIMSEAQTAGLLQLYRPLKEVAMDSTHGTNAYDYQLTTLMIIDEHGEGFPAAFCFSNRVTEVTMRVFLSVCRDNIGRPMADAVLMSDDTDVYCNAWTEVMGPPAHRLLCTWHVDRSWRKNIPKIAADNLVKATVYKTLRALMELPDREVFDEKLADFLATVAADKKTEHFATYFNREYASRPQLWAFCYRRGLHVHHNMHLEALHRVLKHVHMQGRKVRRMDSCIHALLRLMRSKLHDRLLKVHKGKWTRHILGIRNRHRRGVACEPSLVTIVEANKVYAVRGKSADDVYLVEQNDTLPHPESTCQLRCESCRICVHTFSCSCLDAGLRYTICKHVHLVISACNPVISCVPGACDVHPTAPNELPQSAAVTEASDEDGAVFFECVDVGTEEVATSTTVNTAALDETDAILQELSSQAPAVLSTKWQNIEKAKQQWNAICAEMENDENAEIAATVCQHLVRLKSLVAALKTKPVLGEVQKPWEPTNKKVTPQRYFASTKKKPKKRKPEETLSKPDRKQKAYLLSSLSGQSELVSSMVSNTDHDYHVAADETIAFEHSY